MENEFGYIDDKPFKECNKEKQIFSTITIDEDGLEFKINDISKFLLFDDEKTPETIYAVDNNLAAITALNVNVVNINFSSISTTTLKSDFYFKKQNLLEKNEKIGDLIITDNNIIEIFLSKDFSSSHKYINSEKIIIKDNSHFILKFKKGIIEVKFLEYYKTLEYIKLKENEKKGKGKNHTFLKEILKENLTLKEKFFGTQNEDEIEEEIRSLRNYYSHTGYYIDKMQLPIPNESPNRYKNIDSKWLYDVFDFLKVSTYVEIYKLCRLPIDWNDIIYNL